MSLCNSINEFIANVSSRNAKIGNLAELLHNEKYCYDAFALALDPLTTFGFGSVTIPSLHGNQEFDQVAIDGIKYLSTKNHSNESIDFLTNLLEQYNVESQILIKNIILKDLRCGAQLSSLNKAIDICNKLYNTNFAKIHDYPCLLVSAYNEKIVDKIFNNDLGFAICQLKCDGMRFNAVVENDKVTFFGRSGKQIYITDNDFIQQFIKLSDKKNVVYDGELLIDGDATGHAVDRKIGNGILNKAVKGTISTEEQTHITAVIWDRIDLDDFKAGISEDIYHNRYNLLANDFNRVELNRIFIVPTETVTDKSQCEQMFNYMLSEHLEGVIVKSPYNIWKDVRATDMVKFKAELDCDLRVVAVETATGKYQGMLGALVCESDDHKVQVKVGTGYTDEMRSEFIKQDLIGKIVTITYNARIKDKNRPDVDSLFLPRFVEFREDKDTTNTSEEIK